MDVISTCEICDNKEARYIARISERNECSGQWHTYVGVICCECADLSDRNIESHVFSKIVTPEFGSELGELPSVQPPEVPLWICRACRWMVTAPPQAWLKSTPPAICPKCHRAMTYKPLPDVQEPMTEEPK